MDNYRLGGFKLGFWFAQQGSIIGFVIIIFLYAGIMNRVDNKFSKKDKWVLNFLHIYLLAALFFST